MTKTEAYIIWLEDQMKTSFKIGKRFGADSKIGNNMLNKGIGFEFALIAAREIFRPEEINETVCVKCKEDEDDICCEKCPVYIGKNYEN